MTFYKAGSLARVNKTFYKSGSSLMRLHKYVAVVVM